MINRFKLFEELSALHQRLNELFEEQFSPKELSAGVWAPPVDIYETDDNVIVTAELPGVSREAVEVSISQDKLIIRGQRQRSRIADQEHFYRMERQYGSFYRAFNLPQAVEAEGVTAKMNQGILQVIVPKRTAPKAQKIKVNDE